MKLVFSILLVLLSVVSHPSNVFIIARDVTLHQYVGTIYAIDDNEDQYLVFSIQSGNTNNSFEVDSISGDLYISNPEEVNIWGFKLYQLIIRVTDNGIPPLWAEATVSVYVRGGVNYQVWDSLSGTLISILTNNIDFPDNPDRSFIIPTLDATRNSGNNYGARMIGYLTAPITGYYTFWISSNKRGELWLGTDSTYSSLKKIAFVNGWTPYHSWNKYSSQKSLRIYLMQNHIYCIEALMKESTGTDNLSIGWSKPSSRSVVPQEIIPRDVLMPRY